MIGLIFNVFEQLFSESVQPFLYSSCTYIHMPKKRICLELGTKSKYKDLLGKNVDRKKVAMDYNISMRTIQRLIRRMSKAMQKNKSAA